MYKKVYIEITNNCPLNCDFCIKNKRPNKFMSPKEFQIVLNKLKSHTKYLYFHVLGEPLIHPLINDFINLAVENNYYVNITTNGYLINNIKNNKNIRQLNISLHSYNEKYKKSLINYLNDIFLVVDKLKNITYISYRLWVNSKHKEDIINALEKKYNVKISNNMKLEKNVFVDFDDEFIWPSLDNDYYNDKGKCYALKNQIGILVDGTIIPCCLDTLGIIKLGNIFVDNINDIINTSKYQNMLNGFKNNKKIEELCKHCNFIN